MLRLGFVHLAKLGIKFITAIELLQANVGLLNTCACMGTVRMKVQTNRSIGKQRREDMERIISGMK